jgi:hypothetical protein
MKTKRYFMLDERQYVNLVGREDLGLPDVHLKRLAEMFQPGSPFPIRSCLVCGKAFARVGRQLCCSKKCMAVATHRRRKDDPNYRAQAARTAKKYREGKKLKGEQDLPPITPRDPGKRGT